MSESFDSTELCVACMREMQADGWSVGFTAVLRFGCCESCGVEHGTEGPDSRLTIAHGTREVSA